MTQQGQGDVADNAAYLREWAADIRKSNGKSVDADRLDSIAAEIDDLKRASRNRDMWKGQCERQADELTRLRTLLSSSRGEQGALADVLAERHRQMSVEGWSPEHDDTHVNFEMARAAAFYALHTAADALPEPTCGVPSDRYGLFLTADQAWPPEWDHATWKKPKDARRNLVRAAALLVAEIERLDRADGKPGSVPTSLAGQVPDLANEVWRLSMQAQAEIDNGDAEAALPHLVRIAELASAKAAPQPPTTARGGFLDDEPECCPRCGNAWERPDPFALANGIDRAIKKAVSAERARVIALETALRGAIANLEHVSVFDEADDDDQEAIEARSAWQRDLDRFRAALLKASPGGTKDAG
jgi:hypothetical protein